MKKFTALLKTNFQLTFAYREEGLFWFIFEAIPLIFLISLWKSLESIGHISHTQASQLVFYYLAALVISHLTSAEFEDWAINDVKNGDVSNKLLKPFSYQMFLLANQVSWKILQIIYMIPTGLIIFPLLIQFNSFNVSPVNTVYVFIILALVAVQRFFISVMITTSAFWFEQARFLSHLKWMLENAFGGYFLPLYFFPSWFIKIASVLPFYNFYYLPIQILTHNASTSDIRFGMIQGLTWTIILWLGANILWSRGISKFSAVGR